MHWQRNLTARSCYNSSSLDGPAVDVASAGYNPDSESYLKQMHAHTIQTDASTTRGAEVANTIAAGGTCTGTCRRLLKTEDHLSNLHPSDGAYHFRMNVIVAHLSVADLLTESVGTSKHYSTSEASKARVEPKSQTRNTPNPAEEHPERRDP